MKADPEVRMISAEAPILFAKGCDIFITELTMRAWIHAEENKRRTLQRSDIASALSKSDMFDFLIDIVPREESSLDRHKRVVPPTMAPTRQQIQTLRPPPQFMTHMSPAGQGAFVQRPGIYTSDLQSGSGPTGYGGPTGQMYGEMDGMYGYASIQPQQPIYQVQQSQQQLHTQSSSQQQQSQSSRQQQQQQQSLSQSQTPQQSRQAPMGHDLSAVRNDSNVAQHSYIVRDDADADGERDYETSQATESFA